MGYPGPSEVIAAVPTNPPQLCTPNNAWTLLFNDFDLHFRNISNIILQVTDGAMQPYEEAALFGRLNKNLIVQLSIPGLDYSKYVTVPNMTSGTDSSFHEGKRCV